MDQKRFSCYLFVLKYSDVSAKDYANLWPTSIERPLAGTPRVTAKWRFNCNKDSNNINNNIYNNNGDDSDNDNDDDDDNNDDIDLLHKL